MHPRVRPRGEPVPQNQHFPGNQQIPGGLLWPAQTSAIPSSMNGGLAFPVIALASLNVIGVHEEAIRQLMDVRNYLSSVNSLIWFNDTYK